MRHRNSLVLTCILVCCAAFAQAQTHIITFDTDANGNPIASGTTIAEQYAPWGVHFVPNVLGGPNWSGANFATNTDMTATATDFDPNFVADAAQSDLPSGNVLGSYTGYLNANGDPNFWVAFDQPVFNVTLDAYGSGVPNGTIFLYGLDSSFNLVNTLDYGGSAFSNTGWSMQTVETNNDPISYLVFTNSIDEGFPPDPTSAQYDCWIGVDNITFTTAVPEPSVLPLLGSMLLAGSILLRRRAR